MLLSPLLALFYAISFDISLQYLRSISSIVLIRCNKVSYFFTMDNCSSILGISNFV